MKVRELIEELRQYDPDLEVACDDTSAREYEILGVSEYDEENNHVIVIEISEPVA